MVSAPLYLGDAFGFTALILISVSSALMVMRSRLLKMTRNINMLRTVHLAMATSAGLFMVLHVAYYISYPLSLGIVFGYASAAVSFVVWVTGTAFLQRIRETLFVHSTLSIVFLGMVLVHIASTSVNLPPQFSYVLLACVAAIALLNASQVLPRERRPVGGPVGQA
ncbi:MAG: hypothetical protein JRN39_07635 [Nitrososphaerota archaeon]|nr:hypothetical protein [Nitrososphaerota archaeon]